jgi:hypothetical protein
LHIKRLHKLFILNFKIGFLDLFISYSQVVNQAISDE